LEKAASAFVKLGARRYLVISIAMVAVVVLADDVGRVAEARIAVGSCSVVARRLVALEKELIGAAIRDGFLGRVRGEHLQGLSPINDVRATAEYRMDAVRTLVERALNLCVEPV
jgi:CO/xanthine dehydrogenase FAD-binding subunit